MSLDRDLIEAVRDLDEPGLRRLYILARAKLSNTGVLGGSETPVRLRERTVKCGKRGCTQCPHGPYWYAYWSESGRRRSRYIGRLLDED